MAVVIPLNVRWKDLVKKTDELLLCEMSWYFIYLLFFAQLFSCSDKVVSAALSPPSSSRVHKRRLDEDQVSCSKGRKREDIFGATANKTSTTVTALYIEH